MLKILDSFLHKLASDQVKILLDRMDSHPEAFAKQRVGLWDTSQSGWLDLAEHGTFDTFERWAINRKLRRLNLKASRERILDVLVNGDDPYAQLLQRREDAMLRTSRMVVPRKRKPCSL